MADYASLIRPTRINPGYACFIASRHNPELKAYRKRLEERGKCAKAAIIATARKLLTQLNACVKEGRDYEIRSQA